MTVEVSFLGRSRDTQWKRRGSAAYGSEKYDINLFSE
jgi:hypothetical protein